MGGVASPNPQGRGATGEREPMNAHAATASAAAASSLILLREDIASVAVLTLNRPQTRNSLSEAMLEALGDALTAIAHDASVRAVVLAANGPAFSAGHDLKELNSHRADHDRGRAYFKHIMTTCSAMMQQIVTHAAAGHRRGAGDRHRRRLPAGRELRPRGRLADRQVRHARRQYRPVLLDADGRACAQRVAQARDGNAAHRRDDHRRARRAHRSRQPRGRARRTNATKPSRSRGRSPRSRP